MRGGHVGSVQPRMTTATTAASPRCITPPPSTNTSPGTISPRHIPVEVVGEPETIYDWSTAPPRPLGTLSRGPAARHPSLSMASTRADRLGRARMQRRESWEKHRGDTPACGSLIRIDPASQGDRIYSGHPKATRTTSFSSSGIQGRSARSSRASVASTNSWAA